MGSKKFPQSTFSPHRQIYRQMFGKLQIIHSSLQGQVTFLVGSEFISSLWNYHYIEIEVIHSFCVDISFYFSPTLQSLCFAYKEESLINVTDYLTGIKLI